MLSVSFAGMMDGKLSSYSSALLTLILYDYNYNYNYMLSFCSLFNPFFVLKKLERGDKVRQEWKDKVIIFMITSYCKGYTVISDVSFYFSVLYFTNELLAVIKFTPSSILYACSFCRYTHA